MDVDGKQAKKAPAYLQPWWYQRLVMVYQDQHNAHEETYWLSGKTTSITKLTSNNVNGIISNQK